MKRQSGSPPLTDVDILQFALTLEHLESTFYQQGFQKFPDSDFQALGLQQNQIDALKMVAQTEATHVTTLTSAIQGAGAQPVQQCTYNFGFTDAKGMVGTAKILEAVGVSAYLGAAPSINSSAILGTAATIATVEARHQTFLRQAAGAVPVPQAFDDPLGPRSVFTLAAPFIQSCPQGSNLAIQPFPTLQVTNNANITAGSQLNLQSPGQPSGASFCAFTAGGVPGGTVFVPLNNGGCAVPQGLAGEVYMSITKSGQQLADSEILAGPSILSIS
jgi:hypothetical protein